MVTIGGATVDRYYEVQALPEPDGGAFARTVTERFGGVAANVAVGTARLGHDAGIVTRLGDGELGDRALADLRDGPLDTTRVRRGSDQSTHCVILSDADGTRSIVTAGESVRALRLKPADRSYLDAADVVFVTAYAPEPVHEQLRSWADEPAFPPVVFDLSGPRSELADRGASSESVEAWIDRAALFVVGRVAAESAFGRTGREAARHLGNRGVTRAAVTAGSDGATLVATTDSDDRPLIDVPAVAADVTDETGAGDAYVAGLLHAWLAEERSPREAGQFAAAAAALNCEAVGARGGLATVSEIRQAVAERPRID